MEWPLPSINSLPLRVEHRSKRTPEPRQRMPCFLRVIDLLFAQIGDAGIRFFKAHIKEKVLDLAYVFWGRMTQRLIHFLLANLLSCRIQNLQPSSASVRISLIDSLPAECSESSADLLMQYGSAQSMLQTSLSSYAAVESRYLATGKRHPNLSSNRI